MQFTYKLGIDISKSTFNFCLMNESLEVLSEGEVSNTISGISSFIDQLLESHEIEDIREVLLAMEHTGVYNEPLVRGWLKNQGVLSMIASNKISQLLDGVDYWLEKTDAMDARRIAEYAVRFEDKIELYHARNETIINLQALQRQRRRLKDAINLLEVPVKESKSFATLALSSLLDSNQKASIAAMKQDLKRIDDILDQTIDGDSELKELFKLITSI